LIICTSIIITISNDVAAKETVMIPMRDGVQLATDLYRPADQKKHPVLLYRTPYGKGDLLVPTLFISILNLKGYVLVAQDTRGRYASQGKDSVFVTDGWGALQDGYDTVDWLCRQSWCNGKVALFGASASGITAYRAVGSLHPAITCAVAIVAPSDFYSQVVYPGGEYGKALVSGWVNGQGSAYMLDYFSNLPYYDSHWQQMNLHVRTDSIRVPILHIGGWYDCFAAGPVALYNDLKRHKEIPQKLIMGPWIHGSVGSNDQVGELKYPNASYDVMNAALLWFDRWLLGQANGVDTEPTVLYYILGDPDLPKDGGCRWLQADAWPPADVRSVPYYLSSSASLQTGKPDEEKEWHFTYDPKNPVPTLGGNNLNIKAGPYDQKNLTSRSDVLNFATPPLKEPLRLEGYVTATLYVGSDQPDTDFTMKLVDVYPDGREMLVTDGIQRARFRYGFTEALIRWLVPGQVEQVTLSLPPTAILFSANHRIKIAISSSNYDRFELNPNTNLAPNERTSSITALNSIMTGGRYASRVELPLSGSATFVAASTEQPEQSWLSAAYPNPFNAETRLRYSLAKAAQAQIRVINIAGREVRTLYSGYTPAGNHVIAWDGRDNAGAAVPSGMYVVHVRSENMIQSRKVSLVR
jgi:predicted acyl esterase